MPAISIRGLGSMDRVHPDRVEPCSRDSYPRTSRSQTESFPMGKDVVEDDGQGHPFHEKGTLSIAVGVAFDKWNGRPCPSGTTRVEGDGQGCPPHPDRYFDRKNAVYQRNDAQAVFSRETLRRISI